MLITLLAVGRMKNQALRDACNAYERRLQHYVKFGEREVRDAGRKDRDAASARKIEGDAIIGAIPRGSTVVALSRAGLEYDSIGFARRLEKWQHEGRELTFVIGGAHGLDDSVIGKSSHSLSLSAMTLPHELARLVLLEQLYRGFTILKGEPYHKGG